MFERYTESARRVVFFARYEASEFGKSHIETEHLLLGLAREQRWLFQFIPNLPVDSLRQKIESHVSVGIRVSTSVDLPLSNESKRVLAYAAEEAGRLDSREITPAHLLLGLMHEKKGLAAKVLAESGANLPDLRLAISRLPGEKSTGIQASGWPRAVIESRVKDGRRFFWDRRNFAPCDISVRRSDGLISFDLELSENSPEFELVKDGWKESACWLCTRPVVKSDDPTHAFGFTNGRDWVCSDCYDKFFRVVV